MASLKSLLGTKQDAFVSVAESNLEKGQIFTYHNVNLIFQNNSKNY